MCDSTGPIQALRQALSVLPQSAPQRMRSEMSRYLGQLENEASQMARATMKQSVQDLADHAMFAGELADAYKGTPVGEALQMLSSVVQSEQGERKGFVAELLEVPVPYAAGDSGL